MQRLSDDFGNNLPASGVLGSISDLLRDLRKLVDLLSAYSLLTTVSLFLPNSRARAPYRAKVRTRPIESRLPAKEV